MDEFGSPLSGGINAVRRNISSSFFGGGRQQQADSVTTNLLQQQSLQLTSVSQQLQGISRQVSTLDFNLKAVKENLALNEQLERQREGARQNRERILAEQGLREGKESALEAKIQSSLTQPLQRIGIKTQSTLGSLTQFLFTLAGGWLTVTGIDLLQALSEGNVDKINILKTRFLTGLAVIAGSLTAISIGIKKTIGILARFAGNVGRFAFGGFLKVGLKGVQVLLAGLVKKAALIGGGVFTASGIGSLIKQILAFKIGGDIIDRVFGKGRNIVKTFPPGSTGKIDLTKKLKKPRLINKKLSPSGNVKLIDKADDLKKPGIIGKAKKFLLGNQSPSTAAKVNPTRGAGLFGRAKGLLNRGKNLIDDGAKAVAKTGIGGKLVGLTKGLPKLGVGKLLGKVFGPLITFFSEITSADGGLVSALSAVTGYLAGAKIGAAAGGAIGALFGGVGAAPGAFIGALIGGFIGETAIKALAKKIMSALGFKDIKVFGNKDKKENMSEQKTETLEDGSLVSERSYSDKELEILNAGGTLDASGNVVPVKSNKNNVAEQIGSFEEKPEVITLPMGDATSGQNVSGGTGSSKTSNPLPNIGFDNNNPHTLYATSTTGAG